MLEDVVTEIAVYKGLRHHGYLTGRTDENLFSLASAIYGAIHSATPNDSGIMRARKNGFAVLVLLIRVDAVEAIIQEGI